MHRSRKSDTRGHTYLALVGAAALAVSAVTLATPSSARDRAEAVVQPAFAMDAASEIIGYALSDRFPDIRVWPESYDAMAFPNRCWRIVALPCP
jgi:hypothetical protein